MEIQKQNEHFSSLTHFKLINYNLKNSKRISVL